jgi:hypothetical protein
MDKVNVQCSLYAPYRGKRHIVPHILNLGTSWSKVKLEFTLEQTTKAQRGSRCIALLFNLGAKCGWVVNATPRPLYPRERPCTHCIEGWVGPRTGLDGWGKSRPQPHRYSIPGPSSPQRVAIPTELSWLVGTRCSTAVKFTPQTLYHWGKRPTG